MTDSTDPTDPPQPGNSLHGVTLEAMVTALQAHFGWAALGQEVPIRCFTSEPSVVSSLKFLRKTPWARAMVDSLFLWLCRDQARLAREVVRLNRAP